MPLLEYPECLHITLHALSDITHLAGVGPRQDIAREAQILLKVANANPDDIVAIERVTAILSHSVSTAITQSEKPTPVTTKRLAIPKVLSFTVESVRRPTASLDIFGHAIPLLSSAAYYYSNEIITCPSALSLLVACLRSKDITVRAAALGGLITQYANKGQPDHRPFNTPAVVKAMQAKNQSDDMIDATLDYGLMQCELTVIVQTIGENRRVFMRYMQDRDLYQLGLDCSEFVLKTEMAVGGGYQFDGPQVTAKQIGIPFLNWQDSLPHCAKAILDKGKPEEKYKADILTIKHYLITNRTTEAIEYAKGAVERFPTVAYLYYGVAMATPGQQSPMALKMAKKGLKCRSITPYVRFALLIRAVMHAFDMGIEVLRMAHEDIEKWEEGIASLTSAWEDAKEFALNAPPDARKMPNAIYWCILLDLALHGPNVSEDLREAQVEHLWLLPPPKKTDVINFH